MQEIFIAGRDRTGAKKNLSPNAHAFFSQLITIPTSRQPSFHIANATLSFSFHPSLRDLRVLLGEVDTLLDVLGEVLDADVDELLLVGGDIADGVDLLDTVGAELDVGGEEVAALVLVERALDEGGLNDALLALSSAEQGLSEAGTGHGHGQSGGTSATLSLDNLVTTKLDAPDVVVKLLALELVAGLGEQGDNCGTRVTTDDGDVLVGGVRALQLGDEARGTDDIESGDTEEALGVVDTLGLEDLGGDGDGGVNLGNYSV